MTMDEAMLIKQWDSAGGIAKGNDRDGNDGDVSTFAIHSAFIDPSRPEFPARRSAEVRCVIIWEREDGA